MKKRNVLPQICKNVDKIFWRKVFFYLENFITFQHSFSVLRQFLISLLEFGQFSISYLLPINAKSLFGMTADDVASKNRWFQPMSHPTKMVCCPHCFSFFLIIVVEAKT